MRVSTGYIDSNLVASMLLAGAAAVVAAVLRARTARAVSSCHVMRVARARPAELEGPAPVPGAHRSYDAFLRPCAACFRIRLVGRIVR